LAYYDRPEIYLAGLPDDSDRREAFDVWRESARSILDLVRRHRSEIILLCKEECASEPTAWRRFLKEHYDLRPAKDMDPALSDPVRKALALLQVQADRSLTSLIFELDAASHPLRAEQLSAPRIDTVVARAWKHLAEQERRLSAQSHEAASAAQLRANHDAIAKERESLVKKRKATEEENELLLLQLHQVQEELEHYFLENRRLHKKLLGCFAMAPYQLEAKAVHIGFSAEAPPHLHLDFTVEEARLSGRPLGNLRLRLVEHHGRPGLLVFGPAAPKASPTLHWRCDGEERGIYFLLVVPRDRSGAEYLAAAPTSDLLLLRDSARLLLEELLDAAHQGNSHRKHDWIDVVNRFLEQLGEADSRIHYDDIRVRSDATKIEVELINAWTPRDGLQTTLVFVWRDNILEIKSTEKAEASNKAAMDFSPGLGWPAQFAAWGSLDRKTRRLLLLLVAELPNFIHHFVTQNGGQNSRVQSLLKRAQAMRSRANAISSGRRLARLRSILPV